MPQLPVMIRLDGRSFHNFTRKAIKPFDNELHSMMVATLDRLMEETGALAGYTQSDEISLMLCGKDYRSQIYFDGKRDKINSVLAAIATNEFAVQRIRRTKKLISGGDEMDERFDGEAVFDCRCWNVPNKAEACNVFIWREQDAARNSVQMLAQHELGHSLCQNKSCSILQEILFEQKNINWNNLPQQQKNGTFILQKRDDFDRRQFVTTYLPRLTTIANLENVLFNGEQYQLKTI